MHSNQKHDMDVSKQNKIITWLTQITTPEFKMMKHYHLFTHRIQSYAQWSLNIDYSYISCLDQKLIDHSCSHNEYQTSFNISISTWRAQRDQLHLWLLWQDTCVNRLHPLKILLTTKWLIKESEFFWKCIQTIHLYWRQKKLSDLIIQTFLSV